MVKEDDLGHNMAHSSSIYVHNSWLWEATIQELVPCHIPDVYYMDWITQLCSSVDDHYNRWVIILIWSLNANKHVVEYQNNLWKIFDKILHKHWFQIEVYSTWKNKLSLACRSLAI